MTPVIMGILNITPDSFSDGGQFIEEKLAIAQANLLTEQGAKIIDIGGESTRPGSSPINYEDELNRIKNVVQKLTADHFISIDTFREQTAEACLKLGAKMINDVSALRYNQNMAKIIATYDAHVVLMFSKQTGNQPHATKEEKDYIDVIREIKDFLSPRIDYALANGIAKSKIVLDPGMGTFISASPKYSWEVLGRFQELCQYFNEFSLLIGTSRKGFLGTNIENRDHVSQLTALIACAKGAKIIRTHNVEMASEFCKALDSPKH